MTFICSSRVGVQALAHADRDIDAFRDQIYAAGC